MPYVPDDQEASRLRRAIARAALTEGERVLYLVALSSILVVGVILALIGTRSGIPVELWTSGLAAFVVGVLVLYMRLRAPWNRHADAELHGLGLKGRVQRAYTALMLRQAFTGRNPLVRRIDHDPYEAFRERVARAKG